MALWKSTGSREGGSRRYGCLGSAVTVAVGSAGALGKITLKLLPRPTSLATSIRPW
jgi:hypothetical protein